MVEISITEAKLIKQSLMTSSWTESQHLSSQNKNIFSQIRRLIVLGKLPFQRAWFTFYSVLCDAPNHAKRSTSGTESAELGTCW